MNETADEITFGPDDDADFDIPTRDPTPWCTGCGAMTRERCHCGPIAENE